MPQMGFHLNLLTLTHESIMLLLLHRCITLLASLYHIMYYIHALHNTTSITCRITRDTIRGRSRRLIFSADALKLIFETRRKPHWLRSKRIDRAPVFFTTRWPCLEDDTTYTRIIYLHCAWMYKTDARLWDTYYHTLLDTGHFRWDDRWPFRTTRRSRRGLTFGVRLGDSAGVKYTDIPRTRKWFCQFRVRARILTIAM